MKVYDIGRISTENQINTAVMEKPSSSGMGSSFQRQMSDLSQAEYREYIEGLKNSIFAQGEIVKDNADISAFVIYRKLLAQLLNEVASNAYVTSRTGAFDSKGRHKVFIVIKSVNKKLDDMAREILSQQSDSIKLLQMVDDIRGLLVDMLL
jgi:uncharacterized protein